MELVGHSRQTREVSTIMDAHKSAKLQSGSQATSQRPSRKREPIGNEQLVRISEQVGGGAWRSSGYRR
jgi:hypothetical protein